MSVPIIDNSPAIVNLSFVPGNTLSIDINIKDQNDNNFDLTNYTPLASITYDGVNFINFTVTIKTPKTLGETNIYMNNTNTEKIIDQSTWSYTLKNQSNELFTIAMGKVFLQEI